MAEIISTEMARAGLERVLDEWKESGQADTVKGAAILAEFINGKLNADLKLYSAAETVQQ